MAADGAGRAFVERERAAFPEAGEQPALARLAHIGGCRNPGAEPLAAGDAQQSVGFAAVGDHDGCAAGGGALGGFEFGAHAAASARAGGSGEREHVGGAADFGQQAGVSVAARIAVEDAVHIAEQD